MSDSSHIFVIISFDIFVEFVMKFVLIFELNVSFSLSCLFYGVDQLEGNVNMFFTGQTTILLLLLQAHLHISNEFANGLDMFL